MAGVDVRVGAAGLGVVGTDLVEGVGTGVVGPTITFPSASARYDITPKSTMLSITFNWQEQEAQVTWTYKRSSHINLDFLLYLYFGNYT